MEKPDDEAIQQAFQASEFPDKPPASPKVPEQTLLEAIEAHLREIRVTLDEIVGLLKNPPPR